MDEQFQSLPIFEISMIFQIEKILKICQSSILGNSKNFQSGKFQKRPIQKIPKISTIDWFEKW